MIEDEARCMGSFTQMENDLLALASKGNVNCLHEQVYIILLNVQFAKCISSSMCTLTGYH